MILIVIARCFWRKTLDAQEEHQDRHCCDGRVIHFYHLMKTKEVSSFFLCNLFRWRYFTAHIHAPGTMETLFLRPNHSEDIVVEFVVTKFVANKIDNTRMDQEFAKIIGFLAATKSGLGQPSTTVRSELPIAKSHCYRFRWPAMSNQPSVIASPLSKIFHIGSQAFWFVKCLSCRHDCRHRIYNLQEACGNYGS